MGKVICVCNQKGGVGKTTTTVNIGVSLAEQGKKVLLIDADPQGSMTCSLGYRNPDDMKMTLAELLSKFINKEEVIVPKYILKHDEKVDLLPANIELSTLEMNMHSLMCREFIMLELIEVLRENYDYILIDCMPSLGMITINALVASDSVLIPVQAAYLPIKGLQQLISTIVPIRKRLNRRLYIEGVVLTMVDGRTRYAREITETLREAYNGKMKIFDQVIPASVKIVEASANGESIYQYCRKSKVAEAYEKLTKELMESEK